MKSATADITGIILAGGKSSRMRREKGLILFEGKPFLQHIIDAIKPLVTEIIIVSSNPDYDQFAFKRVEDVFQDAGPIAGLHAGLSNSKTKNNLVLSCDVPMITTDLMSKLIQYQNEDYDIIQFESRGKTIPLIALYKKRCASKCIDFLSKGEKRLRKLVLSLNTKTISIKENEHFLVKNINTVEDLNAITNAINY